MDAWLASSYFGGIFWRSPTPPVFISPCIEFNLLSATDERGPDGPRWWYPSFGGHRCVGDVTSGVFHRPRAINGERGLAFLIQPIHGTDRLLVR